MKETLTEPYQTKYKEIAGFLRDHQNLFILAKGPGVFIATYIAEKFTQVVTIHAEAYPSAEFRHGPLSMIDEQEKTPVIFLIFDDENLSQILSNILQVKERGATIIGLSNVQNLATLIDLKKIDFLIEL